MRASLRNTDPMIALQYRVFSVAFNKENRNITCSSVKYLT